MMTDRKPERSNQQNTEHLLNYARPQRILMVADGSLDFGTSHYGLGELVSLLQVEGHNVSTAHRYGLGDNSIEGVFNFAQSSKPITLEHYDQVWLFGFSATPLQEAERRAVACFMDEGGGVFATGGHGLLGSGMGANLPRVRAMRNWSASPIFDERSLDVVLKRAPDAMFPAKMNAPDPAEKISPVFLTNGGDQFLMPSWSPHPLLRHKAGVIDTLPCHSLATECLEPSAKAGSFFAGIEEWPTDLKKPTARPRATIIAKSMHGTEQWGTVSIYDGDNAGVGRIVCDSSWRRFINLNINGVQSMETLADTMQSTHASQHKMHPKLHQYYLNIVWWLTPKTKRDPWNCILSTLARADMLNSPLRELDSTLLAWEPLIRAGTLIEEQLNRQHGGGCSEELINELLDVAQASVALRRMFTLRTSSEILKQNEHPETTLLVPRHLVRRAILGATAQNVLRTFANNETGELAHADTHQHEQLMKMAVRAGVRLAELAIADFLANALKSTREFLHMLRPSAELETINSELATLD